MTERDRLHAAVSDLLATRRACMHQKIDTSTPRQRARGYRPDYCAMCGQDMTDDSGD